MIESEQISKMHYILPRLLNASEEETNNRDKRNKLNNLLASGGGFNGDGQGHVKLSD